MKQKAHNRLNFGISVIAIIVSISFPFIKERVFDQPKVFNTSSKFLNLSHNFGNTFFWLNVELMNTGEKSTIVTKIEVALFNAKNEALIKRSAADIYHINSNYSQNVIALNPKSMGSYNIYFQLNDVESEESLAEIKKLNTSAISDLNKQKVALYNNSAIDRVQLSDSIFKKIINTCNRNMESLKPGDYKFLFYVYQDDDINEPSIVFGKSFSISESRKADLKLSFENYKSGSHLFNSSNLLYSSGIQIRVYDLTQEDMLHFTDKQ